MRTLPFLLVACLLTPAAAEEWKLGETVRYDLTLDPQPDKAPPPPQDPSFLPLLLVSNQDFEDGRRPVRRALTVGDLVWHFALALPEKEGDKQPVKHTFDLPGQGAITVEGEESARKKGKRTQLKALLKIGAAPDANRWVGGGALGLERVFGDGKMERVVFVLELKVRSPAPDAKTPAPPPVLCRWSGTIVAGEALPGEKAFPERVSASIDKGAAWLLKSTRERVVAYKAIKSPDRDALGRVALPVFALLRSGTPDAELVSCWEWIDRQPLLGVYSVSLLVMALEARSVSRTKLPPVAGTRTVARFDRNPMAPPDKERIQKAARWLIGARKAGKGWWSYMARLQDGMPTGPTSDGTNEPGEGDRSNSQYAVLALHAALAAEAEVPVAVWEEILEEALAHQQAKGPEASLEGSEWLEGAALGHDPRDLPPEGTRERAQAPIRPEELLTSRARGWGYPMGRRADGNDAYGSMAAAGLSSLEIAREALEKAGKLPPEKARTALLAVRDGLAWWVPNWDPARNPNRTDWYYYALYSLEKAFDLCGIERVGPHEWWRDVAAELLARQRPDGSWEGSVEETSFALLVLNRATLPSRLDVEQVTRVATGVNDPSRWDRVNVPGVGQVKARQVLKSLLVSGPEEAKERLALGKACLDGLDPAERPRLLPELVDLLQAATPAVRKWAQATAKELGGSDDARVLLPLARRFEAIRAARESLDHTKIPLARAPLQEKTGRPLRRAALLALSRLRAVECVPEVLKEMEDDDPLHRAAAWEALQFLVGAAPPFDPKGEAGARKAQLEAWRAAWAAEGPARTAAEVARRSGLDLAHADRAEAASNRFRGLGKAGLRALVDALRPEASRARAHALLIELTGKKDLPAEPGPWVAWLETQ